ncbi:polyprenyl synthetase family protein [Oceanicoccus sp. KOV_DT_Chl]|uniref:polyprenyl synthetase family protein n=1 Tax=Oceanicoccus sp. KOV_DT_Chl TaxID=1904639 RepID=UPI000C7E4A11|nr:polyprenyl synthetase family protein [Oceanicoccus sp. KOV_DT_Chl]
MQAIRETVSSEFEAVNRLIIDQLHSDVPLVENIGHYIVDAGGKRMRPMLVLLAGGSCNKLNQDHVTLAAVIEFIHTATLLHDDVVDLSNLRRGRPTANAEWGNAPSVLVGDFLYTRAFQLLVAIGNMEVMNLIADTTNNIAEGEVLQLTKAGDPEASESDYFQVIKNKTAVLFAAATAGAAMLSGRDDETVSCYYDYGLNLGLAFQLIDDVLDYEGDPAEMGKNVGDDLAEGKPTLPLIYTLKNGSTTEADIIRRAIMKKSKDNIEQVIQAVQSCGGLDHTKQIAKDHQQKALAAIHHLPPTDYKEAMIKLTHLAITRKN